MILDAGVKLAPPWPDDVLRLGQPEGHKQKAGLIDVLIVLVNHRDLRGRAGQHAPQPVGGECPARAGTKDDDVLCHAPRLAAWGAPAEGHNVTLFALAMGPSALMAEYFIVPAAAANLTRIPAGVPDEKAVDVPSMLSTGFRRSNAPTPSSGTAWPL